LTSTVYRAVFCNPPSENCFLPNRVVSPSRQLPGTVLCSAWGLSLFKSEAELKAFVKKRLATNPLFLKSIGDKVAEGNINAGHGVCGDARGGHFTLHEFAGTKVWKEFKVIGNLP
jgi:hypothetical protein